MLHMVMFLYWLNDQHPVVLKLITTQAQLGWQVLEEDLYYILT